MHFEAVEFSAESALRYSFSLRRPTRKFDPYATVVAVHIGGTYRAGSEGKPDARLIAALNQAAVTVWDADALILDLRNLDYQWGDDMDLACSPPDLPPNLPFAIVVGDRCLPALSTLFFGQHSSRKATEREGVFEDFATAAAWIESHLAQKREALNRKFGPSA